MLIKQKVPISFGQLGIDTKTDEKQQILGKLRKAQNVVYETLQSVKKRPGYDSISLQTLSNSMVSGAKVLTKFNTELNLLDSTTFYSYSPALNRLVEKGPIYSVLPTSTPILRNAEEQDQVDSAFTENLKIFAYHSASTVRYSVQDLESGAFLVSNDVVQTSASNPRVVVVANYVYILYTASTNLNYKRFNILTPDTLETEVNLAMDFQDVFDVRSIQNKAVVVYNDTSDEPNVFGINSDETLTSVVTLTGEDSSQAIDIAFDSSYRVIITFAGATEVTYTVFAFNLVGSLLAPTTIETIANVVTVSSIAVDGTDYRAYYEVSDAAPENHYVKTATTTFGGVVGTPAVLLRSVGLAAKAFSHDGQCYLVVGHESTLQSTYFVINEMGTVVSKVSPALAGTHIDTGVLTKVNELGDSKYLFASQIKGRNVSENGTFFSLLGVNSTILDFELEAPYENATLSPNLHIAGGILQMYDGDVVVEHGFHLYPETLGDGNQSTSGSIADGDFSYIAVYAWTDNQGQIHRSAESLPLDVTVVGGGGTASYDVEVPTLRLTEKEDVILELYRTEDAGTIYYKVTSVASPELNDPTQDSITINDTLSDATLISNEILYTTGGVLENTGAPSCSGIAVHTASNRIVLTGLEDPNLLQVSKIRVENGPVEFNDTLVIPVDPIGGDIVAPFSMDDKIIIFEEDAIFYISGQGPNNLGEQNTFTEPERISIDVGCTEPRSIVLTPNGLMFKSRKGIYILNQSLSLSYIGADVEEFNSLTITSAKIVAKFNQVRFTTSDGACLVYNYHLGLWATFENHEAQSAEVIGNDYYYIRSDSELFKENPEVFADNGSPIKLLLETGWMSFNQLQGFMRAYKLMILGTYKSAHKLRVRFAYNFIDVYVQEKIIDISEFIDHNTYGDDTYGEPEDEPYGGTGQPYQARVDLKKQKCQSIKILIEEFEDQAGEALSLSVMTLEVGGKEGLFKLNSNAKFGSNG